MKKLIASVIILAVFAGAVFFLGWIQFSVPNGCTGIMRSKTSGTYPHPVRAGKIDWAWEKLLPTNCEILLFELKPESETFSASGTLPSAEFYARFLEGSPDFSWKITATVSAQVRAESLPALTERNGIKSDADLKAFITAETHRAFLLAAEKHVNAMSQTAELAAPTVFSSERLASLLEREIAAELELVSVSVTETSFPDFRLYAEGAATYAAYSARLRELAEAIAVRAAETEIETREQMRLFAEWGAFLQKFPSLVDFLAVARDDASGTLELLRALRTEVAE